MQAREHRVGAAVASRTTDTPRVAVVPLPESGAADDFQTRLEQILPGDVCGVVLDRPARPLTDAQAQAAAAGADDLLRAGLAVVLVVADSATDAPTLDGAGFRGQTAPTLTAALALAAHAGGADIPLPPVVEDAPTFDAGAVSDPMADQLLALLAAIGLRTRTALVLAARAADLTPTQYLALYTLAVDGAMEPTTLSDQLALPADEMVAVLFRLRSLGLARPTDTGAVEATPLGREVLFTPTIGLQGDVRDVADALDTKTIETLTRVLQTWALAQDRHNQRIREWIAGAP